jgi:hypothetical protein
MIEDVKKSGIQVNGNNNTINANTFVFNININPVTKLFLEHLEPQQMKHVIEEYDKDSSKFNLLFTNYLNTVLCDKNHPENHSIKYVKKYPPTFNSTHEDTDGKTINTIKGLKDTCDLLTDPLFDVLKKKLRECVKLYKSNNADYDFDLYEDAIQAVQKELKKDNVKKVLSSFLQNDILNNIDMKLSIVK